ncbi:Low-density lipoprotein receptor domain class A [Ancylostoma ceylanicum]|uniref:Low-density lipoprotein receptor domain class A n=1 Tax=Ancylostoma ceylanicum TaxID=53326 RepID=A0A0D6M664_9BILA|nr:Low-density lipoprotein receptor domain class A [Ancylostoma ceylanicum]
MCDGDNDCGDNSDETSTECRSAQCDPPLRFRCAHSRLCLNILQLCNGFNDCGPNDYSDEHLSMCSSFSEYDVRDGYYCHCRDGFKPDPQNPFDCVDIDECAGNNTCTQLCLNTKGSYICRCHEDYDNNVVVGAMTGKDCRAKGDPANVIVAADDELVQVSLHGAGVNRHAAAHVSFQEAWPADEEDNDIIAIAFDPRRALQFWIDDGYRAVYRASEPNGNQSHVGQKLDLDFESAGVRPTNLAVDYLTG